MTPARIGGQPQVRAVIHARRDHSPARGVPGLLPEAAATVDTAGTCDSDGRPLISEILVWLELGVHRLPYGLVSDIVGYHVFARPGRVSRECAAVGGRSGDRPRPAPSSPAGGHLRPGSRGTAPVNPSQHLAGSHPPVSCPAGPACSYAASAASTARYAADACPAIEYARARRISRAVTARGETPSERANARSTRFSALAESGFALPYRTFAQNPAATAPAVGSPTLAAACSAAARCSSAAPVFPLSYAHQPVVAAETVSHAGRVALRGRYET